MAKKYTVYFELYGKKMKTEVYARDSVEAKKADRPSSVVLRRTIENLRGAR
jgi:hypothetical protein